MSMDLYQQPGSAPCRAVMLTAAALDIDDKIKQHAVNLMAGEQFKPEFLKLNPQHTIPTFVDDGFSLWESRSICRYLVNKYGGANNSLYPTDPKIRGLVDQRLDFDLATLYAKYASHFYPIYFGWPKTEGSLEKLKEALGFFNTFLEGSKYAAGDNLTIADLSLVATISTIEVSGVNLADYPNIVRWYELVKETAPKYNKRNAEPLQEFKAIINGKK